MWQIAASVATTTATVVFAGLGLQYTKKLDFTAFFGVFFSIMAVFFNVINAYIPMTLGSSTVQSPFYQGSIITMIIVTNAITLFVMYKVFSWMLEVARNAKKDLS